LDALVRLNRTVSVDKWIQAINASDAVKSALATPGLKTLLAPSNAVVGDTAITDEIILSNLFNGNLTAAALISLCEIGAQITSVSGEKFNVNCTRSSSARSRRVVTTIRISNSASNATLTVLDMPSKFGTAHGTDAVLMPSSGSGSGNDKSASWYDKPNPAQWGLIIVAALLVLLVLVALVLAKRSRHEPKAPSSHDGYDGGWPTRESDDDFAVVDNALAELARANSARPTHYYPAPEADERRGAGPRSNAPTHYFPAAGPTNPDDGKPRPLAGRAQITHYYPASHGMTDTAKPERPPLASSRTKSTRSGRGPKLSTPQHPIFSNRDGGSSTGLSRSNSAWEPPRRPQYVDPAPLEGGGRPRDDHY
jgi:hypothetical protein